VYLAQSLLNPLPWALLGALLSPSLLALCVVGGVALVKLVHDVTVFHLSRPGQPMPWTVLPAVLLKDALLFVAWTNGLFARTLDWRGTPLRVLPGSRLVPATPSSLPVGMSTSEPERTEELLAG